jgi:lysophospholipase L1-like esterase
MNILRTALALSLLSTSTAYAQTAPAPAPTPAATPAPTGPQGMVDNPCEGVPPIPPALVDYVRNMFKPGQTGPAPAPTAAALAEVNAYRTAQAEHAKVDFPNLCYYRADNAKLLAGPASGHTVVFMGDSITQTWGLADEPFFTNGIVDRGISGQTTPQMVLRFMADVVALHPQVVHIMAGTNDLAGNTGANSPQDYKNNIMTMVALAKANGIRVILASIPPTAGFTWKPDVKPTNLRALNAWLKDYAAKEGLVFVDYVSVLQTPEGALKPEFTADGVHPNYKGFMAMEPLTRAALAKAMKKR